MSIKIAVISGTNRPSSVGRKVADWALAQLPKEEDVAYSMVDLAEENLPFLHEPNLPAMGKYQNESTKNWSKKIAEYDGYIIVAAEYNHGYSAVLKNAIDTLYVEWQKKPVAFVGYGALGASASIEHLVPTLTQIGAVPHQGTAVKVIDIWEAINEDGTIKHEKVRGSFEGLHKNLVWYAKVLKDVRDNKT